MSGLFGGPDIPTVQAEQPRRTAERLEGGRPEDRRKRRAQASILTRDWNKPKLAEKGLLGLQ
jgi:hypothetical protein